MILQRLATSIRRQDWFTVFIETLIVVLGVFFGLQLGNWNEARAERAQETELLRALHQEIETSIRLTDQKVDAIRQVVAAGKRSLDFLESGESCGDECWSVLVDFFHASQWQSIEVDRSTYDEMRRQGFPRSRDIVDVVEGYLAQNATLSITNELPAYRSRVRQLIPFDAQEFYWDNCYILNDGAETYILDCAKGISDKAAARAVGRIADTPDIPLLLTQWVGLQSATPADLIVQNRTAEIAMEGIEAELERRE